TRIVRVALTHRELGIPLRRAWVSSIVRALRIPQLGQPAPLRPRVLVGGVHCLGAWPLLVELGDLRTKDLAFPTSTPKLRDTREESEEPFSQHCHHRRSFLRR